MRYYFVYNGENCGKLISVTKGDEVVLRKEPDTHYDKNAVQMLDVLGHLLGYIPGYYSEGVSRMIESNKKIICRVSYVDNNKNCNECIRVILKCLL